LGLAEALVRREIDGMLLAPGSAVVVIEHHLHPDSLAVPLHQGFGDGGQGEFLDRHENLAIRLVDGSQHHGLEVIALAPTPCQGAAVLPITVVVEANLNALW
jgi:hypothetical protein